MGSLHGGFRSAVCLEVSRSKCLYDGFTLDLGRVVGCGIGVFPRSECLGNIDNLPSVSKHVTVDVLEDLDIRSGGFVLEHNQTGALGAREPAAHRSRNAVDCVLRVVTNRPVGRVLVPDNGGQAEDLLGNHSYTVVGLGE